MTIYPTQWKRSDMRGCFPGCERMDLPVEVRSTDSKTLQVRHIHPESEIVNLLENNCYAVGSKKIDNPKRWEVSCRKTKSSKLLTATGKSRREAYQNLMEVLGVKFNHVG